MKQYGYLRAIYLSFYSRDLYRDVAKNWGAGVLLYLLLVLALCWVVMIFRIQPAINQGAAQFVEVIVPQLPSFIHIEDGVAKTPENRPYYIKNPETKEVIAIIDTSGKYKNLEEARTRLLITKDKAIYTDNEVIKIKKIPEHFTLRINRAETKEVTLKFMGWLWIILLPLFILVSFLYRLIQSIIYAIFGTFFAVMMGVNTPYATVFKLTMVALTPAIVISTVTDWFGYGFYHHMLLYFILSMAYLIYAIRANKNA
ncbi:MAG: hypothetical protein ACD_60C00076G0002 [uncultured bacterium]|nr:MAG: hypothetical protein ACD_60C00076G0002 [uncultured bacterium]